MNAGEMGERLDAGERVVFAGLQRPQTHVWTMQQTGLSALFLAGKKQIRALRPLQAKAEVSKGNTGCAKQ